MRRVGSVNAGEAEHMFLSKNVLPERGNCVRYDVMRRTQWCARFLFLRGFSFAPRPASGFIMMIICA